jgi:Ni,Fe-hydrogenase I large subunit
VPVNRAEGDLEISVDIDDGVVVDAWSSGTMYRGFENIIAGRAPLDSLVITPRICGICSTAHLTAACKALDMIAGVEPPPNAVRIRNIALMIEKIQSDVRHAFLMFMPDFTNPAYTNCDFYEEAVSRFKPFQGKAVFDVIRETKKVIGIIAIIGGQWPHSSYMVPGGIVSMPSPGDMTQCYFLIRQFRAWYEQHVLGCTIERWQEIQNESDLMKWLSENTSHKNSPLGFYLRMARVIGLDKIGQSHDNFISYGAYEIPDDSEIKSLGSTDQLLPAGFARNTDIFSFDESKIEEHLSHSWFIDSKKKTGTRRAAKHSLIPTLRKGKGIPG